jgi:sugar phosphate isomerase/epimerase
MRYHRREFLGVAGAGLASLALRPPGREADRIKRIGVQLYTVRDAMKSDFEGTLARVAAIGYREVEFAGYFGHTAAQLRGILHQSGLDAPSAHIGIESLGDEWGKTLDDAHTAGHRYLVVAWLDEVDRKDLDAYRRVAERFNRAGVTAAQAGIRLAYHNHEFEFAPMEGRIPYDVLLEATDPQLVALEMDLYWITKGGQDPLTYFARWPGRFPMVHVKDSAGPPEHRMADVGAGSIDWRALFARRKQAGIEHFFVEHDEPADPFASITTSYRYLRELRF